MFLILFINKILSFFKFKLSRVKNPIPKEFVEKFQKDFIYLKKNNSDLIILKKLRYEIGDHPENIHNYECSFASCLINQLKPQKILDIGSYRKFILGMLSHYQVTTIDIRKRKITLPNETIITCDAKSLNLPDDEFDIVISLCSIEHFGLGRYGDEIDLNADKKAFKELIRVLKPNGHIIFTVPITNDKSFLLFNASRVYDYKTIKNLCNNLTLVEEKFYNYRTKNFCSFNGLSASSKEYRNVYFGCWKKKR